MEANFFGEPDPSLSWLNETRWENDVASEARSRMKNCELRIGAIIGFSFFAAIELFASLAGPRKEIPNVLKSTQVDAMFAKTQHSLTVIRGRRYSVALRVTSGKSAREQDLDADEIWFVRQGRATLTLNGSRKSAKSGPSGQQYDLNAGDMVHLSRRTIYQISSNTARFEYMEIRIFPEARHLPGTGSVGAPMHLMPTIVHKSTLDIQYANAGRNTVLFSGGGVFVVSIVAPPSWPASSFPEAHRNCDDFYSIRLGTARIAIGGTILNPKEGPAGEIHGTRAVGAHEYTIGSGDLVSIPRNTMHDVLPMSKQFSYVLVKVCGEDNSP